MLDKDKHVYCTNCIHFRIIDGDMPYCKYAPESCIDYNPEDSMLIEVRPMYEPY